MATEESVERNSSLLEAVSSALVRLHKEQFGRGPTRSRSHFTSDDGLVCVLRDALLPAERKMVKLGQQERVRETRGAFQAAAREEFVAATEAIVDREVIAFASAVDPDRGIVFENFLFAPRDSGSS
ncbi:MAG: DUF2294 family protein [Solirubrobacterales bacterium]|nr:DUF2294 family protein [Solirubrobacterales bacterium]